MRVFSFYLIYLLYLDYMKHIPQETLEQLKKALVDEQLQLEKSLGDSGKVIDGDGDWAATVPVADESEEDYTVQADRMEEFFTRGAAVGELEARLENVKLALGKMDDNTYGLSTISNEPIELERLVANPAATTTMSEVQKQDEDKDEDKN